jgi:hypothetical protein
VPPLGPNGVRSVLGSHARFACPLREYRGPACVAIADPPTESRRTRCRRARTPWSLTVGVFRHSSRGTPSGESHGHFGCAQRLGRGGDRMMCDRGSPRPCRRETDAATEHSALGNVGPVVWSRLGPEGVHRAGALTCARSASFGISESRSVAISRSYLAIVRASERSRSGLCGLSYGSA